ncbi:MAG TPA: RNA methyltransferase [Chitinophagaceae bacterium]|nr:RNA methyltransferase [Chitinophagaceae bacterium]
MAHKKQRDDAGLFVAEGPKIINDFLHTIPDRVKKIYATDEWAKENERGIDNVPLSIISQKELERITQLKTPNQVVAVVEKTKSKEPSIANEVGLYLDTIQDPGNFGTIVRIADWFGIKNIVCSEGCADLYNAKVMQASMASMARVNVWYDVNEHWLAKQKTTIFAATLNGKSFYDVEKIDKGILVIGNESRGVRPDFLQMAATEITIPKKGRAESLNAAVATGILLSQLLK